MECATVGVLKKSPYTDAHTHCTARTDRYTYYKTIVTVIAVNPLSQLKFKKQNFMIL